MAKDCTTDKLVYNIDEDQITRYDVTTRLQMFSRNYDLAEKDWLPERDFDYFQSETNKLIPL